MALGPWSAIHLGLLPILQLDQQECPNTLGSARVHCLTRRFFPAIGGDWDSDRWIQTGWSNKQCPGRKWRALGYNIYARAMP